MRYGILALVLILMSSVSIFADTLYEEGFEDGSGPPTDWVVWEEGAGGGVNWNFTSDAYPNSGTYYMFHSYYPVGHNNWAVTQTMDASSYSNLNLELWHSGGFAIDYDYTGIWVSTVASPASTSDFTELVEIGAS